jgi:hypothetical protein
VEYLALVIAVLLSPSSFTPTLHPLDAYTYHYDIDIC